MSLPDWCVTHLPTFVLNVVSCVYRLICHMCNLMWHTSHLPRCHISATVFHLSSVPTRHSLMCSDAPLRAVNVRQCNRQCNHQYLPVIVSLSVQSPVQSLVCSALTRQCVSAILSLPASFSVCQCDGQSDNIVISVSV